MEGVAMRATKSWAGALASACILASTASAQYVVPVAAPGYAPVLRTPLGIAPDACGPGYYVYCPNGQTIGPNYYLRPCFEPFQGVRPTVYQVNGGLTCLPQREAQYPYHPFARGPRDFFMFRENMDEQHGRQARPNLLP
jgi:hypothetical protein